MNQRMYELINQCFIGTTDGKLSELNTVANIEKFAQLIVDECLNQCYYCSMNDELYAGQLRAALYIEQHFGVEP